MRVSIIADDLTGAADSAVGFLERGASVVLSGRAGSGNLLVGAASVLAIDLDNRERLDEAPAECRAALAHALAEGGSDGLVFAKIDSTLRGPVEAAIAALAGDTTSERATVYVCPAFPHHGRTFLGGIGRLSGQPVELTPFGREQGLAEGHADLGARLARQGLTSVILTRAALGDDPAAEARLAEFLAAPPAPVVLIDALEQRDLDRAARIILRDARRPRFAGAAGLARALAAALPASPVAMPERVPLAGSILFILGTATALARQQLAALALTDIIETGPDGAFTLEGLRALDAVIAAGRDCAVTLPPAQGALDPALVMRLAASLPALPAALGGLVLTGGATARAVLDRLGVARLDLIDEPEPGIAIARAAPYPHPLTVVLKAGGFGRPETLAAIRQALRAPSFQPIRSPL
jgi:uncharacterized protein YgbK (DUF1537 family)